MSRLKKKSDLKRIKVNDAGEYIEFSINEEKFIKSFADLIEWIDGQTERISELAKEKERLLSIECDLDVNALGNVFRLEEEMSRQGCRMIDVMFGTGTCKKIFGDSVPELYSVFDFIEQFSKLVEKFAEEQNRKGNRK